MHAVVVLREARVRESNDREPLTESKISSRRVWMDLLSVCLLGLDSNQLERLQEKAVKEADSGEIKACHGH